MSEVFNDNIAGLGMEEIITQSLEIEKAAEAEAALLIANKKPITQESFDKAENAKKLGNKLFVEHNYLEAIQQYDISLQCFPTEASYFANRSVCHLNRRDFLPALHDALIATRVAPKWSKGYYRLAMARLAVGRHTDASSAAMEGICIDPGNAGLLRVFKRCVQIGKHEYNEEVEAARRERERRRAAATAELLRVLPVEPSDRI